MRDHQSHPWMYQFGMAAFQLCAIGTWFFFNDGFVAWFFLLLSIGCLMAKTFLDNTPSNED